MRKTVIGADIGGTTVKIGLFEDGLIEKWEIPTDKSEKGKNILRSVWQSVESKLAELGRTPSQLAGMGIAVPGPVLNGCVVNRCVNLGWGVLNLSEEMKKYTSVPATFLNDANAAALGEYSVAGEGKYRSAVFVTLGTGVGGGIIVGGKVLEGASGCGGEIGHICVNPTETLSCGCGKKGCIEQYASATGIVRMAKELMSEEKAAGTSGAAPLSELNELTSKDVFDSAKAGDQLSIKVFNRFCDYLGRALASVACVVNPELFIIGGGVSKAGAFLINGLQADYKRYAFHGCEETPMVLAKLGNDAGIYGAAKAATELCE